MDPLRVAVRCVFTYVVLMIFLRLSGKRSISQGNAFQFTLALVLGDLVDDMVWAEVGAAQFLVAAGSLVSAQVLLDWWTSRTAAFRG